MEQIQGTEETIEVFENDIDLFLNQFMQEQKIKDMKKEPQNVWNAALIYIQRHVFGDRKKLKINTRLDGYVNENSKLNYSNCNAYDIDKVNYIADYYIYICSLFDKEISINGFSLLTGIADNTIIEWGKKNRALSTAGCEIYKKICKFREESLSAKLLTGGKNSVGILGILNHQFGWNMPGVSRENAGSIEKRTPEQIAQEYGSETLEKPPELPGD